MSTLALPKPTRAKRVRRSPRRTRKVRPGRITLKNLDDLARPLCRARGVCEAKSYLGHGPSKGCSKDLQWAHIISRTYRTAIRWSRDNCLCLCSAHHKFFTDRPIEWGRFLAFKIGPSHLFDLEQQALRESREKSDRLGSKLDLDVWHRGITRSEWSNRLVIHP